MSYPRETITVSCGVTDVRVRDPPGAGEPRSTLRAGDLALTSTRLDDGAVTVEVARRRPDGTWRWIIDEPRAAG
jgi:hypothetical protein